MMGVWNSNGDPAKADQNLRKHDVSFEEAATVFDSPLSVTVPDPDHSWYEERYIMVGRSFQNRLLIVSHTEIAGAARVRIISARPLTRHERRAFEEGAWEE
ncbi:MAG: BrnT family toxin [Anaerolineales bacterium]|nr:BrnT family toxin [Anaerolineales bacterium]